MVTKQEIFLARWLMGLITVFLSGELTKICTIEAAFQEFHGQSHFHSCRQLQGMWLVLVSY